MTTYLITGAAGFLGFYIAKALSERVDAHVICVDNFIRGEMDDDYKSLVARENVTHHGINLNNYDELAVLPREVDYIFHLAALNGTQNFYERPFEVVKCCTLPTMHLIDYYGENCRSRFIYAGTSEAYASTVSRFDWPVPTGEDVPLGIDDVFNPRWSYGASKMHGEIATINGCRHFGVPFTIVRYHNAYGPRMGDKHVIPDFLNRANDGIFVLYGYADTRSFIYASDAARATIELAECAGAAGEVVNVGGAAEITMKELGETIMAVCGLTGDIELHPSPEGSVARRAPMLDKLRSLTGYREEVDLAKGLRLTADFYLR